MRTYIVQDSNAAQAVASTPRGARGSRFLTSTSVAALALSAGLIAAPAQATDWTGATSNDWFVNGNWSTAQTPVVNTDADINTAAPNATVISGAAAIANDVHVAVTATGNLTIRNGGSLNNFNGYVGMMAGSNGSVTITGTDSRWTNDSALYVGRSGAGSVTVQNGGKLQDITGYVGYAAGSTGTVTVDGPNAIWINTSNIKIGFDGSGAVVLSNGGVIATGGTMIAEGATSTGSVTVTGAGSALNNSSLLTVGAAGAGALNLLGGGSASSDGGILGDLTGTGTVTITGAGSKWVNTGTFLVGNVGGGALTVSAGGLLSTQPALIGVAAGSTGNLTVSGAGSNWTANGAIAVGAAGSGTLNILNGGSVVNASALISYQGGAGAVTVSGAGSSWNSSGPVQVGYAGSGVLTLSNGGSITANGLIIASLAGSNGVFNIGGAAGSPALAAGTTSASIAFGAGAGVLNFNHTEALYGLTSAISGNGVVNQLSGVTALSGAGGGFSGSTFVQGGRLLVNGALGGTTTVQSGGALGGSGTLTGAVTVQGGGALQGLEGQTLTLGSLVLENGATTQVTLGAPGGATLFNVTGDLTLDGALDVAGAGGFGAGVYRIFTYGGALTDNTLDPGLVPAGYSGVVQTSVASQVNLVVSGGAPGVIADFQFWNGTTTVANGAVNGGSGTWTSGAVTNWTDVSGSDDDAWNDKFAVFQNNPGAVTVDGSAGGVSASALQFIGQGWTVSGDAIALTGADEETLIRVGDGSLAGAGDYATISSVLTGTGRLIKDDLGTLILTGDSTYSGGTTVKAGRLTVNGRIGAIEVLAAGTLQGAGTVGDAVIRGTVAPGNSIGVLHVTGGVTFANGSVYQVEASAAGEADRIQATGGATINGGTVQVLAGAGVYNPATVYTILTADGGVGGAFKGVTSNLAFLDPYLTYDAKNVYLTLVRNDIHFVTMGVTPNQIATGGAVEPLGWGDPVYNAVLNLSGPQARDAFDQLSGEIHASTRVALIEDSRFVREAVLTRLRVASDSSLTTTWGQVFGAWSEEDGDGNAAGLEHAVSGLLFGADGPAFTGWRIGVVGGFSQGRAEVQDRHASGESDNYHLGLYAGRTWGPFALRTGLAYTRHELSIRRSVDIPGYSADLSSDYGSQTAQVFAEAGYVIQAGKTQFEPFAAIALVRLRTDAFNERGGDAALAAGDSSTAVTVSTLGLRTSTYVTFASLTGTVEGSLGWRHAFGDVDPSDFAFAGGDRFRISGVPIAEDAAVIGAGIDFEVSRAASFSLTYGGQFGPETSEQTFKANVALRF